MLECQRWLQGLIRESGGGGVRGGLSHASVLQHWYSWSDLQAVCMYGGDRNRCIL
jgi:hypothetical protein